MYAHGMALVNGIYWSDGKDIQYRKLTLKDLDIFIETRMCQLQEEGAKELLLRAVNEAKKNGCRAIQITASDMGVLLYSNFGFVKNGNFMQYKL